MSLYKVLADKLSHSTFGILTKGSKFNADDKQVSELVEAGTVELVEEVEVHDALTEQELLDKGVSQEDIDLAVSEGEESDVDLEVKPRRKKGRK